MDQTSLSDCTPLMAVQARLQVPGVLPFSIRDADGLLLLARGQVLQSREQLLSMMARGAQVAVEDVLLDVEASIRRMPEAELSRAWTDHLTQLRSALRVAQPATFHQALSTAVRPVAALIERDPDLAIVQVLRQNRPSVQAGLTRSAQTAIAAQMAAQVLGWAPEQGYRAFKAALTMNVSILELQGVLSLQASPLTAEQREALRSHPAESRRLLEASGVGDADWLDAVVHHHDVEAVAGDPARWGEIPELARVLYWSDVYTAMLCGRSYRAPLPADQAARRLFNKGMRDPMCSAVIKAFGLYPPGCTVRLANGEAAVVVRRGAAANAPVVRPLRSAGRASADEGAEIEAAPGSRYAVAQALVA